MVKAWQKYIDKLTSKEKIIFRDIIQKLILKDFDWLDIVRLSWFTDTYRCRVWIKRIVFSVVSWKINILKVWPRWGIYK